MDIEIRPTADSTLASLYGHFEATQGVVTERTTCNYGLAVTVDHIASSMGMRVAALDDLGEVRAVERADHPFFIATLYQPQIGSTADSPHPVFVGLLRAAIG
ncbi:MAG: hypothetical protein AAF567_23000 [Actinomycetota bacterium]